MSTSSDNTAKAAASSTASRLSDELGSALASADAAATSTMQNLSLVHQARITQLSRSAASLKAQYGADDSRVKAAEAAVGAGTTTVARIAIVNQQLATPAPTVVAHGWALHGRVFNAQLQPVGNLTVFLVDSHRTYQQAYGFAYTDSTGYFLLNYAGGGSKAKASTTQLFVEIANHDGKPIYLATTAFQPALGTATYQNTTLPVGEQPLGEPPQAVRRSAMPDPPKEL